MGNWVPEILHCVQDDTGETLRMTPKDRGLLMENGVLEILHCVQDDTGELSGLYRVEECREERFFASLRMTRERRSE